MRKDLNNSENIYINKNKNKNNSIILGDNDTNILKKIRSNTNQKDFNCSINKLNNRKCNKKIFVTEESKGTHKSKILKKKNKIQ